jgi:hypothetical protein
VQPQYAPSWGCPAIACKGAITSRLGKSVKDTKRYFKRNFFHTITEGTSCHHLGIRIATSMCHNESQSTKRKSSTKW